MGAACAALLAALCNVGHAGDFEPNAAAIRSHVRFLADDLLEGREAGSRGEALAAAYIAAQFESLGIEPGGDHGSYFQTVPLVSSRAADEGSFAVSSSSGSQTLRFDEDYIPTPSFTERTRDIAASLVFAGFGIVAPERGIDSYAGIDAHGKIVLVLKGAPHYLPNEERAFYSSAQVKRETAAKHGAAAVVFLYTPTAQRVEAFDHLVKNWNETKATWVDSAGNPHTTGLPDLATVSLAGAQKLLAGAPISFDSIMSAAESEGGVVQSFALPTTAAARARSDISSARGSNVIGIVRGSDSRLKAEYLVLTGHYDHLGIGAPVNGDAIYNGALDNAAGIAVLMETARGFTSGKRPRRSIMLVLTTAEEKGLVGSEYFAKHPTVARGSIVANINVDMPLLTYDFADIVTFGADHSSLGPVVNRNAARLEIRSAADPWAEQAVFIRSDHYRFVQQGIPAVMVATGPGGAGRAAYEDFLSHRYHQPNDDVTQPLNYEAAAKLARLIHAISTDVADERQRPTWNQRDFFGLKFAPSGD